MNRKPIDLNELLKGIFNDLDKIPIAYHLTDDELYDAVKLLHSHGEPGNLQPKVKPKTLAAFEGVDFKFSARSRVTGEHVELCTCEKCDSVTSIGLIVKYNRTLAAKVLADMSKVSESFATTVVNSLFPIEN